MTRVLTLFLVLCPVFAWAEEPKSEPAEEWGTTIEVEVPRPKVSYIVTRQKVDDLELKPLREDFIPKIVRSVERTPF
ncbi:MAG: hypothetical protein GY898_18520 [Proteobacteria bacterium]|nr:hypothetical protein [Pseudomonadota bacterium]